LSDRLVFIYVAQLFKMETFNLITQDQFSPIWEETVGKALQVLNKNKCLVVNGMSEKSETLYVEASKMDFEKISEKIDLREL